MSYPFRALSRKALGIAVVVAAAACSPGDTTDPRLATLNSNKTSRSSGHRRAGESNLWDVADHVPGFAGAYFDAAGVLVVRTTVPDQGPAAAARVRSQLPPGALRRIGSRVRVDTAEFDFATLAGWRDDAATVVYDIDGFIDLDLDERTGTIRIGFRDNHTLDVARQLLAQKGIPDRVLRLGLSKPVTVTSDLYERYRPLLAGTQVGPRGCSLGYIAWWGGEYVMLQPSHCSASVNSLDGGNTWQQYAITQLSGTPVHWGSEIWDTGGYVCGTLNLSRCREADVSVYSLTGIDVRAGETGWTVGLIARTMFSTPGTSMSAGSIDVNPASPWFVVQGGDGPAPYSGQPVEKVGVATGWTTGTVNDTCSDKLASTGIHLVCQASANLYALGGDSGSPVFSEFDLVYYDGMIWGSDSDQGSPVAWYSPAGQIRRELGSRQLILIN